MPPIFITYSSDARDFALALNDALNPFALSNAQRVYLADLIGESFSVAELEGLCFALDVPYDELPGDIKSKKVHELILWFERRRDMAELIAYSKLTRPLKPFPQAAEAINRIAIRYQDNDHAEHISAALKGCAVVAFIASRESVRDDAPQFACVREAAVSYKRRIVTVATEHMSLPRLLLHRKSLVITNAAQAAEAVRAHLEWLRTPEGELQSLRERLTDAQQDLTIAGDEARIRIEREAANLEADIEAARRTAKDDGAALQQAEARITAGIERERELVNPASAIARAKFINPPPGEAPTYFQDRYVEMQLLANFLRDEQRRMMTVIGRGGTGKTALVCRLLKAVEAGQLPYDLGAFASDGIIYLSMATSRPINFINLFADLCKLLPGETSAALDALYKDAKVKTADKMQALLAAFADSGRQHIVVLLDNFETLLDAQSNLTDAELDEALRAMLNAPWRHPKFIITTRDRPFQLMLAQPGRQGRLEMDAGLESPFAENLLREMDADGTVGFRHAPEALLAKAREYTRGFPRALEALYGIVAADREARLAAILAAPERLPEHVTEALVGEAFSRLDPASRRAIIALAIYARPVTANAVDFLLQPSMPGADSAPLLKRLVGMHFVRSDAGRYTLHSVDRDYALSRVGQGFGSLGDLRGLKLRAADYFAQTRRPAEQWKTLDDLAPQLAEFDLRCEAEDWDNAARVLHTIDFYYLLLWGYPRLVVQLHERLHGKIGDVELRSKSLGRLAPAYYYLGDTRRAIEYQEQELAIVRQIGDRRREGAALINLGSTYGDLGDTRQAITFYKQALAIVHEIGDRRREGAALTNLGSTYGDLGDTRQAVTFFEQALVILRESGDRRIEGSTLNGLGNAYSNMGDVRHAMECQEQALAIAREIGDRGSEGLALGNLGDIYSNLGDVRQAIEHQEQALAIFREIGNRREEGIRCGELAETLVNTGDLAHAIAHAQDAVAIAESLGDVVHCCNNGRILGLAYLCSGDLHAARDAAERASTFDSPPHLPAAFAVLGVAAIRLNDRDAAHTAFESAITYADALLAKNDRAYVALDTKGLVLCGLTVLTGDPSYAGRSREAYRAARAIIREKGVVGRAVRLLDQLELVAPSPEGVREAATGLDG